MWSSFTSAPAAIAVTPSCGAGHGCATAPGPQRPLPAVHTREASGVVGVEVTPAVGSGEHEPPTAPSHPTARGAPRAPRRQSPAPPPTAGSPSSSPAATPTARLRPGPAARPRGASRCSRSTRCRRSSANSPTRSPAVRRRRTTNARYRGSMPLGEQGHVARLEEAHLLRLDPRRLDPLQRVARQHVVLHRRREHATQRPVDQVGTVAGSSRPADSSASQARSITLSSFAS